MHSPRHARPSARRPVAAIGLTAVAAAAIAVPLSTSQSPASAAPGPHTDHATDDAHILLAAPPVKASSPVVTTARVLVRPGNTLWGIAGSVCGNPGDDLALAYNNGIKDPNLIAAGQLLKVACHAAVKVLAEKYPPPPLPASLPVSPPVTASQPVAQTDSVSAAQVPTSSTSQVGSSLGEAKYTGSSSMQQCIISRESGGNSQVVNATDHYGLYQFSYSTWVAHGGSAADFGHASVAEQNAVYGQTVADDGYSDWSPYDGC
jgi:hypothetical protein